MYDGWNVKEEHVRQALDEVRKEKAEKDRNKLAKLQIPNGSMTWPHGARRASGN